MLQWSVRTSVADGSERGMCVTVIAAHDRHARRTRLQRSTPPPIPGDSARGGRDGPHPFPVVSDPFHGFQNTFQRLCSLLSA